MLGSLQFSRIIPLVFKKVDVCSVSEDGNPGSANVFKYCGIFTGIICLFLDILKGFIPPFVAILFLPVNSVFFSLDMVAPVLGHAVGLFNRFNGGKCIATSIGVVLASLFITYIGAILAVTYVACAIIFKKDHRTASVVAFSIFALSATILGFIVRAPFVGIGFLFISVTAISKHLPKRTNERVEDKSDTV